MSVVMPCQECGAELYDRVTWDEAQELPVCPDCGAGVSAGDPEALQAAVHALLLRASEPITVNPRHAQDRYVLVNAYLLDAIREAMTPRTSEQTDTRWLLERLDAAEATISALRAAGDAMAEGIAMIGLKSCRDDCDHSLCRASRSVEHWRALSPAADPGSGGGE